MAEFDESSSTATNADGPQSRRYDVRYYTGIVLVQGMGTRARNETLEETLDALAYWFNHQAGLALRPQGPGRVWLTTQLTEDAQENDAYAPASRATIELAAPRTLAGAQGGGSPDLRLEFCEVWWGQSFSLPSVGLGLQWIGAQFREVIGRLLSPLSGRAGRQYLPGPGLQFARAYGLRPDETIKARSTDVASQIPSPVSGAVVMQRVRRFPLRLLLGLYELIQYAWKAVQWLFLTLLMSLIYLLLLLLGVVRVAGIIPVALTPLVEGLRGLAVYLSLHWLDPMRVYLNDYARATAIRQRFERELETFLRDDRCDRIIVLAHSMGAVIAYDGLSTALAQPDVQEYPKPITFICLGAALQRAWRLSAADPRRLRGILPEYVRWINFWARYDPIAAGPLSAHSLPHLTVWGDPELPDPEMAIRSRLDHCENVDVVNADSFLFDHITYWDNLEQVVGPLARELVAGHPALEQVSQAHLASPDEILLRRWRIAWHSTVGLIVGGAAAAAILVRDEQQHWAWGSAFDSLVFGQSLRALNYVLGLIFPPCSGGHTCSDALGQAIQSLLNLALSQGGVLPNIPPIMPALLTTGLLAIALMGTGNLLVTRLSSPPSAAFRRGPTTSVGSTQSIMILLIASLGLLSLTSLLLQSSAESLGMWTLSLAQLIGLVAWLVCLVHTIRLRRWGWCAAIALGTGMLLPKNPFLLASPGALTSAAVYSHGRAIAVTDLSTFGTLLALAGAVLVLNMFASRREWSRFAGMAVMTLLLLQLALVFAFDATRFDFPFLQHLADLGQLPFLNQESISVGPLTPMLIYGLWSSQQRSSSAPRETGAALWILTLLLIAYVVILAHRSLDIVWGDAVWNSWLIGIAAWGLAMLDTVRRRRWRWLAATALLLPLMVIYTMPGLGFLAAALVYGLWADPVPDAWQPATYD